MAIPKPVSTVSTQRYHALSIGLHWLMLFLLIAVYASIELRELFPKGTDARKAMKMWHFMLGLSVLAFAVLRVLIRLRNPTPAIIPAPPAWQEILAKVMHIALYALMLGMPLAGWLILSAEAQPIPFFGLELPALIGPDKALAKSIEEVHETVGLVGYYLIGLHALAGLYHHYMVKDNTLKRMLP
ncbi:cytochrome b [Undibacterium macrobrachii]|jgi:cytochrome b561|uniref:Cytochrome b561 n=1 Tax=Undibacterium macrobrachii TaxID=1119058 RepID=A0ABQ2XD57_9BURK|nr:cytochrome b [Undibacterium macrobrachii]GGX11432.1 cytochrome b561 [Undibacterium macrobrachii]